MTRKNSGNDNNIPNNSTGSSNDNPIDGDNDILRGEAQAAPSCKLAMAGYFGR